MTSALAPFAAKPKTKQDRLSIQNVDDLLFSDFNQKSMNVSTPTKELTPIDDMDESEDIFNDNIPTIFGTLLSKSKVGTRENTYPILKETSGFQFKNLETAGQEKEEKDIVTLASALFDDIEVSESTVPNITTTLVERTRKSYLEIGFNKAIQAAIDANSNHLSVVVTLSDSNDAVIRTIAKNQLDSWSSRNATHTIPKPIIKVYQLLAGEFDKITIGLPWNLGLALKLFYGDFKDITSLIKEFKYLLPLESPVADILNLYIGGISSSSIESTV
ncbi:hypothetical protein Cantr_05679 [Candida viswanathii]|uniref:Nuclear pore complex protein NUP96 C-terminal domain-containing protein n=1 Tax=Candida viswanathii TaxID=5486 RepID=A0A367XR38_9ASCO|nr:hypothetical protein Cantr_05679 [Candida viswanathii]